MSNLRSQRRGQLQRQRVAQYLFDVVEDGDLAKIGDRMFFGLGVARYH
jgi:hypothetical protein